MSISKRLLIVATVSLIAMSASRSRADDNSPSTLVKTFTTEATSGCLKQFDAQGNQPKEGLNTQPESPEETTFEAMGIKCGRAIIKPSANTVVVPGSKEKPKSESGCRFLFERNFISISGDSPEELRAVLLYPQHNLTLDIQPDSVTARSMEIVPLEPDFQQLLGAANKAIAACFGHAPG